MSERTIAEIIGFEQICLGWDSVAVEDDDIAIPQWSTPTVDDLLAWLACDTYFLCELMWHDDVWWIGFKNTDSGLDGDWFNRPTLLAALEAAVRAADSQSSLTAAPTGGGVEARPHIPGAATSPGEPL